MKTLSIKLSIGTVLAVTAIGLTACSQANAQQDTASSVSVQTQSEQATASFSIEKMTCATCPISVKKAMKRVDGVKSVSVDFETKVATVVYDPSKASTEQIAAASTDVGYPATEVTA